MPEHRRGQAHFRSDVEAQRVIPRPPAEVAAYAMDWRHDHEWTQGIKTAALTRPADSASGSGSGSGDGDADSDADSDADRFGLGAEVTRTARFLGKRIDYVLRVVGYDPPTELDMKSVAGPMPMHVTYRFAPHPDGTLASIRVRGDASTYYRLAGPIMGLMVRRNLRRDLSDLHSRLASPGR